MKVALPALLLALFCINSAFAAPRMKNVDFTKGETLDPGTKHKALDRRLGPTGLWAQSYSAGMQDGASRDARQFLIVKVEAGSPAEGKIEIGDVILGTNGKDFDRDARKALADAIETAEETTGKLSLKVWRKGKTGDIGLQLKVMGTFDPNKPFNCTYTDAVIDQMVQHALAAKLPPEKRANNDDYVPFMPSMCALGMLATGDERLMSKVKAYAHYLIIDQKTGKPITFEVSSNGKRVWNTSYNLIFLAEYFLATGDKTVLPAIETWGVGAAMGQSGAGTYGHRFSSRKPDDSYHGPLEGYGAINNAALSMTCGILLAKKCGIEHPEIDAAIARSKRFFDFFVGHGGIPYGDHWAGSHYFDNNGTSGIISIMYGLMGDVHGQQFFSAMAVGSAPTGREEGHQGCYWSHLWDDLGAARSGPLGLNASFNETRFIRTLERGWNGQIHDQSDIGPTKYKGRGDVTGSRLLMMSLGRKKTHFSGKGLDVDPPISGTFLEETLEGGRLIYNKELRAKMSEDDIFRLLRHPLPPVRIMAATAMQEQKLNRVDKLITMLNDDNRYARHGACNGLAKAGYDSKEAVDALIQRMLKDEDILLRYFAVDALQSGKGQGTGLHGAAGPAVPILLELASKPAPDDPRGHLTWQIAEALFYHRYALFATYPATTPEDQAMLVEAVRQFLMNENGRARSSVNFEVLNEKQLGMLWESIIEATRENAPSGIMFSKGVRQKGLEVLAKNRIAEGLDVMMELSKPYLVKSEQTAWVPWFAETMLVVLPLYGPDAMPILEVVEQWPVLEGRGKAIAEKLPALKKEIANAPKVQLVKARK